MLPTVSLPKKAAMKKDTPSGQVIQSRIPESWQDFFELMKTVDVPDDFLADRKDTPPQTRDFSDTGL
jgi:antitoxin VapB